MGTAYLMAPHNIVRSHAASEGKGLSQAPMSVETGSDGTAVFPWGKVILVDPVGRTFQGVPVSASGAGPVDLEIKVGDSAFRARVSESDIRAGGTIPVRLPVRAPEPFIRASEVGAGAVGLALSLVGYMEDIAPVQVAGEILFGAAVFTVIYRHAC